MVDSSTAVVVESGNDNNNNWPTLVSSDAPSSCEEDWTACDNNNDNGSTDEWEMIPPPNDENVHVVVTTSPPHLDRRNSASSPDLRQIEILRSCEQQQRKEGGDEDESMVLVSDSVSVASSTFSKISFRDAMLSTPKAHSFRDAILRPVNEQQQRSDKEESGRNQPPSSAPRPKFKPRFVVTPIKRSAKSTPNLRALIEDDDDDGEICGATDAMEYYNQKAHGYHGRVTGMKQRPDELKRQQMIVQKKNLQRQQQQGGGGRRKKK